MQVLFYSQLNTAPVQKQFDKTVAYLKQDDFKSADVRKMRNVGGFYRAKLDDTNRLLFQIGEYKGHKYIFLLEVILNHDYDKSRFLNGAKVDEGKLLEQHDAHHLDESEILDLKYLNPKSKQFSFLDKIVSMDETQEGVMNHQMPLIVMGPAGSGKTILTLEKMKYSEGKILYVSLSSHLVEKSKSIYFNCHGEEAQQEIHFLSFHDFLFQKTVPKGQEVTYVDFASWFERHRNASKLKDVHKIFEELRGVITGATNDKPYLSREEYLALGPRQSVLFSEERHLMYDLFLKYLDWLKAENRFDINLAAYEYLKNIEPEYELLVVDEVQDMTNIQLSLLLKTLKNPNNFILCGDANQVVHPNFFSWASIKRLLYGLHIKQDILRILPANYRNSTAVTDISNRLLALKNVRFGSLDKESTFLVKSKSEHKGQVQFLLESEDLRVELKKIASVSARIAFIVLREEDKKSLKEQFNTPLIFTIHEAKGLEYFNIVLYNIISDAQQEFEEICEGIMPKFLGKGLVYNRPKNKADRSFEAYKFYINALYVGMTRAVENLVVVERHKKHRLLTLLGVKDLRKTLHIYCPVSTREEWQAESTRLEKAGKIVQAANIRAKIQTYKQPDWEVMDYEKYIALRQTFFTTVNPFSMRKKLILFNMALFYDDSVCMTLLFKEKFNRVKRLASEKLKSEQAMLALYHKDSVQKIEPYIKKYGPNYRNELNLTPLMLAALAGAENIARYLISAGAEIFDTDNYGRNAFMLAIHKAHENENYASLHFKKMCPILIPPYLETFLPPTPINLPSTDWFFFIVSIILSIQRKLFSVNVSREHAGLNVDDFMKILSHIPIEMLPDAKVTRKFVSKYLNKFDFHESKMPMLIKLRRGYFTLAPFVHIKLKDEWVSCMELFGWQDMLMLAESVPHIKLYLDDTALLFENVNKSRLGFEEKLMEEMED